MNNFRYIKYSAFLLPAFAVGISIASAGDEKRNDPCDHERTTASATAEQDRDRIVAGDPPMKSNRDDVVFKSDTSDKTNTSATASTSAKAGIGDPNYLANKPANNFFSTNLIGQDVTNKRNGKVIGTVEEILIDRDGQVGAVILSTGGLMGIGEKDVAIAWDQIKRTIGDDEIELSVDFTEASLAEAPTFDRK